MSPYSVSSAVKVLRRSGLLQQRLRELLVASTLAVALSSCGSSASRDVLAYEACLARHPKEVALCEGPRQAYELNPTAFQERASAFNPGSR